MLNDNTGHTALSRQRCEQFRNRLEAARRGSHGYDRTCHIALLGATHPALDGTTTAVVGHQYSQFSHLSERKVPPRMPSVDGGRPPGRGRTPILGRQPACPWSRRDPTVDWNWWVV